MHSPPQLFIHSPVSLDDKLLQAIEALGEVKWVVSPNYEHIKYAREWSERFPKAIMIACPGLMEREPDVYKVEIPFGIRPGDNAPGLWDWKGFSGADAVHLYKFNSAVKSRNAIIHGKN